MTKRIERERLFTPEAYVGPPCRVNHRGRMVMRKLGRMLGSSMASDPSKETKPEDEARARGKTSESDGKDSVQPSREKVSEGPDNLRRRADWFQKRTGGTS
jgi:hypothetical protein